MQHANSQRGGGKTMEKLPSTIPARPVVRAASAFGQRPDRVPKSAAIDLGDDTLLITLEEVVSPAEKTPPLAGADAIQMRAIYRQFIADALATLRQHMNALSDEYESAPEAVPVFASAEGRAPDGWDSHDRASSEDQRLRRFVHSPTSHVH
jgi:uncharacterized protein YbcI